MDIREPIPTPLFFFKYQRPLKVDFNMIFLYLPVSADEQTV